MLTYILALAVGFGSIGIYLAAFFFPEIHRKNDFIWSGIGLFYALTLWVFAPRLTGWLFLGHVASVVLLGWFGWQTLSLRRQLTPQIQQTPVPGSTTATTSVGPQSTKPSIPQRISGFITGLTSKFTGAKTPPSKTTKPATIGKTLVEVVDRTTPEPATEVTETTTPISEQPTKLDTTTATSPVTEVSETTQEQTPREPEVTPPLSPSPEMVENATEDTSVSPTELSHEEVEKIAPESQLAPGAEAPPEKIPPKDVEN